MKQTTTLILLLAVFTAQAQTNVWLGNNSIWLNNANWSLGTFPTSSCASDIEIPSAPVGGFFPALGPSISPFIGNLTMGDGAKITIGLGLNICGNINAGSTDGAHFLGNGIVNLIGTGTQDINGKCCFRKVRSDNSSVNGININGAVEVSTFWQMKDGDIWNNGTFTLKATQDSSAFMDFFTYTVGGVFTGLMTVEQYVANAADGYRDICLPVSTNVADLATNFSVVGQNGVNCWYAYTPYPTLQEYKEDANADTDNYYGGFWSFTAPGSYFEFGKGYAARIYNAPLTLSVTGNMNYGFNFVPITNTPSSIPSADGWNLVGNPYPAPIKWSSLKAMNAGRTSGSCYRFSTTGEYAGTWSAHNGVTGVPLSTPDEISTFQGFFVLAPANDYLFFDNSLCTGGNEVEFYKTEDIANEVRLKITNGTHADEVVAYTDAAASYNYDAGQDAVKIPAGGNVQMGFPIAGKELAINVLDEITAQSELSLNVSVTDNGNYTISAIGLNLTGLTAYLKDAQTNTLYDLTSAAPSFALTGGQTYTGRFSVVFDNSTVSGVQKEVESFSKIYSAGNRIFVNRSSADAATINVASVVGQKITSQTISGTNTVIELPSAGSHYVFVKLTEGSKVSLAKVLITN